MKIGIEQTLINALVRTHTPLVTPELATRLFTDLATSEIIVVPTAGDVTSMKFTADITCERRRFRAPDQTWQGSPLQDIIKPELLYSGTLDEFLAEGDNALILVDDGKLYVPYSPDDTYMTEAEALELLSFATGFDFGDIGEINGIHATNFFTKETITTPPANLTNRLEAVWTITGGIISGTVFFINDGYFSFAEDVDLGTLPTQLNGVLAENGNSFVTEQGTSIVTE